MGDILLVDDDEDYGEAFADILCFKGHTVRLARNGEEGLKLLHAAHPEVVVLDVDMPVLTGPEMAFEMLLRNVGKEKIPIIFISGNVDLREIAARVGTGYFLMKPAELRVILALIDRVLVERRAPTWPRPPSR
jgi:DNA-binding NtrC family response regulator